MIEHGFEALWKSLSEGSDAETEEAFRILEPFVKMVVRRHLAPQLRSKIDPTDVVQSVWVELIRGCQQGRWTFADAAHLRSFLWKMAHDRTIDRCRQLRLASGRESSLPEASWNGLPAPREPGPLERIEADELWEHMLAECPSHHHDVLVLRRQGLRIEEIARRSGLHESSVRRILSDVARRVMTRPA